MAGLSERLICHSGHPTEFTRYPTRLEEAQIPNRDLGLFSLVAAVQKKLPRTVVSGRGRPEDTSDMGRVAKNREFVQIPHHLRPLVSDGAYATYAAILEMGAWQPGGEFFRGLDVLAEARGKNVETIRRHLRELEQVEAIFVIYRGKRQKAKIEVLEWSSIWAGEPTKTWDHPVMDMPIHTTSDPTKIWDHSEGDPTKMTGVTPQKCGIHREEDTQKKTPFKQEDPSTPLVEEELEESTEDARESNHPAPSVADAPSVAGDPGEEGRWPSLGGDGGLSGPEWWVDENQLIVREDLGDGPDAQRLLASAEYAITIIRPEFVLRTLQSMWDLAPTLKQAADAAESTFGVPESA